LSSADVNAPAVVFFAQLKSGHPILFGKSHFYRMLILEGEIIGLWQNCPPTCFSAGISLALRVALAPNQT
jgi:hypothetical protein